MKFVSKLSLAVGGLSALACGGSSSHSMASTAPSPVGGGALDGAQRRDHGAFARPARRTQGRVAGCRRGDLESPDGLAHAAARALRRSHQFRPGVLRCQRHPGQLQRLPDLGHLESERSRGCGSAKLCPASQSDVSVYQNLLFVSAEAPDGPARLRRRRRRGETVSKDRIRGVRIFDISDINNPKYLANVQTCRGSHTHTVVTDPNDKANIYIYISGTSGVRPAAELPAARPTRAIRTRRSSTSKSSRCRWRIPSRRRS